MTTTTLVLTALPSQAPAPTPRLTVLVSPRLAAPSSSPLTLDAFALGGRPWPDLLREATLTVHFDTSSAPVSLAPTRAREELDAGLWRDLFPGTTPVVPHHFDADSRVVRSYPAADVAAHLYDTYRQVATSSPRDLPPVFHAPEHDQGDPPVTELDRFVHDLATVDEALAQYAGTPFENSPRFWRSLSPRARAFYQAKRFYLRRRQGEAPPPLDLDDEPELPDLDFHQMVSLLADHPTIQRRLGLVFDVALPAPTWWTSTGRVHVTATWTSGPAIAIVSPRTHYTLGAGRFLPRYHGGVEAVPTHLADGYLRLDRSDAYGVVQVDTDGGALQSVDFAVSVRREATELARPPIRETSLPTLRSGGITLLRHQRALWLSSRRSRAQALIAADGSAELYAEDLLRGYRIDVSDGGGPWRSLCRRVGEITAAGRDLSIPVGDDEEGYVKAASGTSTARNDELYLHEAIAGWDGWSLCARRPGRAVIFDKGDHQRDPGEAIGDPVNEPNTWLDVSAEYRPAPGSLPRLRFGRRYRLRARAVDLAGGSLPVSDPVATYATPEIVYQRHEPVPPPVLVPRRRISEGESLEHMVIRSTPGQTPAEYVKTPAGRGYTADNQRHVIAPKCTLAMAEAHGMLDAGLADPERWYHVARKEAGSLVPSQDQLTYVDAETRSDVEMTGLEICQPPSAITATAAAVPERRGDPLAPGQYVIHTGVEVPMPWLPDPLALGFVLQDVTPAPGSTGPVTMYVGYGARAVSWSPALASWPEKRSVRVVLQGATGDRVVRHAPGSDARTIIFAVPQGHQLRLRYSSLPDADRLHETALWHLLTDADRAALRDDIEHGKHWMLTPFRELVLVHAVQRPVTGPAFAPGLTVARDPGETAARLSGAMLSHGWSTSHVDVRAGWDDPVDDPASPRPVMVRGSGDAFRVAIAYAQTSTPLLHQARAAERQVVTSPVPHTRLWNVDDVHRNARHELGDTLHRRVTYTPVGTTRYQEYFPPALIADPRNLQTEGEPLLASVPSSARPVAPRVLYAVPTFAWDPPRDSEPDATVRRRLGSGLRIYLDRPWFSSGRGERLAVVCEEQPADWLTPHVSTWGRDPAWTGEALPRMAVTDVIADAGEAKWFPGSDAGERVVHAHGVALPEAVVPVSVAGVIPQWSEERKLWYADVELDTRGAYWPFVSLALARWQPDSIAGCALSPVVRCHFAQVAPDRAASVVRHGDLVDVVLTGITAGNSLEQLGAQNDADPRPWWWWYYYGQHTYTSGAGHRVYARIEHQGADARPHEDLAWATVRGPVELRSRWDGGSTVTWSGQLDASGLPSGRLRVVVTEAEIYESDAPGTTVKVYGWEQYRTARERIVYIDTFTI